MSVSAVDSGGWRSTVGTWCRLGAALALLVGGLVHLQLYVDGYRDYPNPSLGRSFLVNVAASVLVSLLLVWRRELVVRLAGIAVLAGTLVAFVLSRSDDGIFGFSERGLQPSPQAALALLTEAVGLVLLAVTFLPAVGSGEVLRPPLVAGAIAAALLVVAAAATLWSREATTTVTDAVATTAPATPAASQSTPMTMPTTTAVPPDTAADPTPAGPVAATTTTAPAPPPATSGVVTVSIEDFAFRDQTIEVPVGATVEWVNNDSFAHTVESDDGSFVSPDLATGDTFSFTFDAAGNFSYICGIHPSMLGTVVVTG